MSLRKIGRKAQKSRHLPSLPINSSCRNKSMLVLKQHHSYTLLEILEERKNNFVYFQGQQCLAAKLKAKWISRTPPLSQSTLLLAIDQTEFCSRISLSFLGSLLPVCFVFSSKLLAAGRRRWNTRFHLGDNNPLTLLSSVAKGPTGSGQHKITPHRSEIREFHWRG